jgi:hypothetical protein
MCNMTAALCRYDPSFCAHDAACECSVLMCQELMTSTLLLLDLAGPRLNTDCHACLLVHCIAQIVICR